MFSDHEVEAEIGDVLELDLVADRVAATEIAGALTAVAAAALVPIAKARAANHALAASLKIDKKTAVPNRGKNKL